MTVSNTQPTENAPSFAPVIEHKRFTVTLSGPNAAMPTQQGFYVSLMDDSEFHPAKRLVKGAFGSNLCTALGTLANVIEADFWLSPTVKLAAIQAIDRRLGEMGH